METKSETMLAAMVRAALAADGGAKLRRRAGVWCIVEADGAVAVEGVDLAEYVAFLAGCGVARARRHAACLSRAAFLNSAGLA